MFLKSVKFDVGKVSEIRVIILFFHKFGYCLDTKLQFNSFVIGSAIFHW